MIDLSKNENPYLPNKQILNFMKKNIHLIAKYPTSNSNDVIKTITQYFGIHPDFCCLTTGTLEGMELILKTLNKKSLALFIPTFWGMKFLANKLNYDIKEYLLDNNLYYNIELINEVAKKIDLIYLCNPNNPTLDQISKKELLKIIKNNKNCHFIIDETVLAFSPKYKNLSLYNEVNNYDNLSVLLSYSKILSIPGLRIGLLFSNKKLVSNIKNNKLIYSTNTFGEIFLKKFSYKLFNIDNLKAKIQRNFNFLEKWINKNYLKKIIKNNGSFVLIELNEQVKATNLCKFFENNNILISNASEAYPELKGNFIRVSAGTKKDIKKFCKKFNSYCKNIQINK